MAKNIFTARNKIRIPAKGRMGAYKKLNNVIDNNTKNLLRGILDYKEDTVPPYKQLEKIKLTASLSDIGLASEILFGSDGAFPLPNIVRSASSLLRPHALSALKPDAEVAFLAGRLNSWSDNAEVILDSMARFAAIPSSDPNDSLTALGLFIERFGISNYAMRKLAYIMARNGHNEMLQQKFQIIADSISHNKSSSPYFMSMEMFDIEFPLFASYKTRAEIYKKYFNSDFRQILALNEMVPAPLSDVDLARYIIKAHATSIVDECLAAVICISGSTVWSGLSNSLSSLLKPKIDAAIKRVIAAPLDAQLLFDDAPADEHDAAFYRRSAAFIEFPVCSEYRRFIDRVIAPRILKSFKLDPGMCNENYVLTGRQDLFLNPIKSFQPGLPQQPDECGSFGKTVQFLSFINDEIYPLDIDADEMIFICEHTTALDILLSEQEINLLYEKAESGARPIITVLALALFKSKRHDDDVDFRFRLSLSQMILESHRGSIAEFFDWILYRAPQIANYLVSLLDRNTLQKMYWLINSADQADVARQRLLRAVGKQRKEIKYFVEADNIEAQRQVSKLQIYFDSSRIYVDEVNMKNWLTANPNSYAQQYLKMIELNINVVPAKSVVVTDGVISFIGETEIATVTAFDFVLTEAARIAFEQFCINRDFGIESYLGRRIRHNTVTNMMRSGVEELIDTPQFRILKYDRDFMNAYEVWRELYRKSIDHIRKNVLQFKTDTRPEGIFTSSIMNDDNTRSAIGTLRNTVIAAKNTEIFNEVLIRYCWQEIDPQLKRATNLISVKLLQESQEQMEQFFAPFNDDAQREFVIMLRQLLHERFTRLGSWFRQPESGFVNASTKQLCELIIVEAGKTINADGVPIQWIGDGQTVKIYGLSVHRMYDCLFVILHNALRHGKTGAPIRLEVTQFPTAQETLRRIGVKVTSEFENAEKRAHDLARLERSFSADDLGAAMVVEGYSGIKKLRYITRINEGRHTSSYTYDETTCSVSFLLTVELASDPEGE